jgi:ABC-type transport system substrate-binding protein
MMPMNHLRRRDVLLGSGATLLAGATTRQAHAAGTVLRVSNRANPDGLDPATGIAGSDHVALYPIYATLVEWDYATLKARPGIAEEWSFPDPLTMVLKLRSGVLFHDGTPCDAAAVKFNLERCVNEPRSSVKGDVSSIASVETRGTDQVVVHLKLPNTALPLALSDRSGMMISPKALTRSPNGVVRNPVGAGPWKFVSWQDNARIVLARNESYFKPGFPRIDNLEFTIIPELNTGLRSVIAGENDVIFRVEPPQKTVIDRAKNVTLVMGPTLYVHQFFLNLSHPPFDNLKLRQALNYAIDREAFNKATMLGLAEPTNTLLPKSHWAHDPSLDAAYPYDPAQARRLMAEAGVANGFEFNVLGYPDQTAQQRQEVLMEQLGKVGIRLKFTRASVGDSSAMYFGPEKRGDALLAAWTGRPDPSSSYAQNFAKEGFYNTGHVQLVPELPEALAAAQSIVDLDQRREAFRRVQKLVVDNALFCPLVFDPEIDAHGPRVKNYRPNLLGKPKFDEVELA